MMYYKGQADEIINSIDGLVGLIAGYGGFGRRVKTRLRKQLM